MADKHGPNRLSSYVEIHDTVMMHLHRAGFVLSNDLVFTPLRDSILLEGQVECLGGLLVDVRKILSILEGLGAESIVRTANYSYNVSLRGLGNVFRYDSPHATHNRFHHVHRYDILNDDRDGSVVIIPDPNDVPTLGEVVDEAVNWYFLHADQIETNSKRRRH